MMYSPFGGFGDIMFTIVPVIIFIGFVFVFGIIIVRSIQGAKRWKRNNESPVLTVDATVVTKRANVHNYHHDTGTDSMHHMLSSTIYYVTFEVTSGDRLEFEVCDTEYGMLAENDIGKLTFQGSRYLGFERNRSSTTDIEKAYDEIKSNGVQVGELMNMPYGKMFTFKDQDGNDYMLREDK